MQTFDSGREAKEYLVARIVEEAEREGAPLSEIERKMMYFTETAWSLPDIWEVNEVFEQDYDAPAYEVKIGNLARRAKDHAARTNELQVWKEAVRTLKQEDHYLSILLTTSTGRFDSLFASWWKLIGIAILICLLFVVGAVLFSSK